MSFVNFKIFVFAIWFKIFPAHVNILSIIKHLLQPLNINIYTSYLIVDKANNTGLQYKFYRSDSDVSSPQRLCFRKVTTKSRRKLIWDNNISNDGFVSVNGIINK